MSSRSFCCGEGLSLRAALYRSSDCGMCFWTRSRSPVFSISTALCFVSGISSRYFNPSAGGNPVASFKSTTFKCDHASSGLQDFSYIGTAAFGGLGAASAGQLRWQALSGPAGGVVIDADLNGDGIADMQIMLTGLTGLAQTDFLL